MKQVFAAADGIGETIRIDRGWGAVEVVSRAARTEDRLASFHPMQGYSIAQTVALKIEGAHLPENENTRQCSRSIYAAY